MAGKPSSSQGSRWYPTVTQLADPAATHRAMKQVLDQFYALQDQHNALRAAHAALQEKVNAKPDGAAGNGPSDTKLLGLNVEPVDTQTLANGATLKYNSKRGTFSFQ